MSLLDNPLLTSTLAGYPILDESTREHFGRADSDAEWTFVCRWTDRAALVFKLLGGAALVSGIITPGSITYHPLYPWMAAIDVDIEGVHGADGLTVGAGGMVAYRYARMTVKFGNLGTGDVEYGEERIDYSAKVITVPDGTFGYDGTVGIDGGLGGLGDDNARILLRGAESPGLIIPQATLQRTILRQPSIPVNTIFALLGHVNNANFLGGGTGTVLFLGCCSERTFSAAGNKLWSITYSLLYSAKGHNRFLIPDQGVSTWKDITDANGDPPYPLGDLSQLGFSV